MAGSYNHVVTKNGNLVSNESFVNMIENLGDAYEMTEELFGMIWWLAAELINQQQFALIALEVTPTKRFELIKDAVEKARQEHKDGLAFSREIHKLVPDNQKGDE